MTILILMIWPKTLIEAASPDACPYCFRSTELMIVLMLGEEKSAKPSPTHTSMAIITPSGVSGPMKASIASPDEHMAMPVVAK